MSNNHCFAINTLNKINKPNNTISSAINQHALSVLSDLLNYYKLLSVEPIYYVAL